MILVLCILVLAIVLFATEKLPIDLVALLIMAILLISGIITPEQGIAGFSNTATVTVGAMFILSAALFRTGAVNIIGELCARLFKLNFWIALTLMMLMVAALSAFINNTPVVALFIPIIVKIGHDSSISPSKLLMPISFASMFGGICTLIGTSTNILIGSIAESHGLEPFGMFEFTSLGLVFVVIGTLYMVLIGVRLIPERRKDEDLTNRFGLGNYLTEVILSPEAKSVGKTVEEAPLVKDLGVEILEVRREGKRLQLPQSKTILKANDILKVIGDIEKVKRLQERVGITLKSKLKWIDADLESDEVMLVEAVIAPNSLLERKTLKQIRFRNTFGATALAIRHRGEVMHRNIGNTKLRAGDALLIEVRTDYLDRLKENEAFVIVTESGLPRFRKKKIVPALMIMAGVVVFAATGILPIVITAIAGCVLMVLVRCITLEEAYKAIDWRVIFLLAGALTLGAALETTGTARFLSEMIVSSVGVFGPVALIGAFYLLTTLLSNVMSNNATAALIAPIAIATAASLQVDARPLLMAVAFAASASFMTPVGYQTNTMILGPGQYRFPDFLKVGTPINILFWIAATILIPQLWPF